MTKELSYWPYCEVCKTPYRFDSDEPFANCNCGTTEWGSPRPAEYVLNPGKIATVLRATRIVTVHMLIDVENDVEACDYMSKMLRQTEGVLDWGYTEIPNKNGEYSKPFEYDPYEYREGQFIDEMEVGTNG